MKGSIGTPTRLTRKTEGVSKKIQGWRQKKNLVLKYIWSGHSVKEAAIKFKIKKNTVYKMIKFGY